MNFLHISDLHIGRKIFDLSLMDDQRAILAQIMTIITGGNVDALIIAGDIFDKAQPAPDSLKTFSDFLSDVVQSGKRVFMISGNHDTAEQIAYLGNILTCANVFVSHPFDGVLQRIGLSDDYGPIDIWLLPFLKPVHVRRFFPDVKIDSYEQAVKAVIGAAPIDGGRRNLLVAHQYVVGAEVCESEERMIGGLEQISRTVFDPFDYVAMGHLHSPQSVGNVRYAGSPLKYSFSEAKQHKSVTLVKLGVKAEIEMISVLPPHDMRIVEGKVDELKNEYSEDYIQAIVTDEQLPLDVRGTLKTSYPNLANVQFKNSRTNEEIIAAEASNVENMDPLSLFIEFYTAQNNGVKPDNHRIEIIKNILNAGADHETD